MHISIQQVLTLSEQTLSELGYDKERFAHYLGQAFDRLYRDIDNVRYLLDGGHLLPEEVERYNAHQKQLAQLAEAVYTRMRAIKDSLPKRHQSISRAAIRDRVRSLIEKEKNRRESVG